MIRVLNRQLLGDFIKGFLLSVAVLTFVMYIGAVIRAIDYMSRGISGLLIMKIFSLNIPYTLSFVIPVSVLITVLLHFGRLSADGEITAMKACGISLWQIAAPILFCSILLSAFSLFLNAEMSPRSHFIRRQMLRELGEEDPLALLDEGRFVNDFPDVKVYVGKKSDSHLEDIIIYQFDENGARAEVRARSGEVVFNKETRVMEINLEQVRLTEFDKNDPSDLTKARNLSAESYPIILDLRKMLTKSKISKKPSDMTFSELLVAIQNVRQAFPDIQEKNVPRMRAKMAVDASQRLALALACFSFTLVTIPLALGSRRKESFLRNLLTLLLPVLFYASIIISDALVDRPEWRPDMIPWIPVLGFQAIGVILMHKNR